MEPWLVMQLVPIEISAGIIKPIIHFLWDRKLRVSSEGENVCAPGLYHKVPSCLLPCIACKEMILGNSMGPLSPLCWRHVYICHTSQSYVLRKLHCSLTSLELWCERWDTK